MERKYIISEGERFERLVTIKKTKNKSNNVVWECLCDCGKTSFVTPYNLCNGRTRSCGCLHNELISKYMFADLTDKKFGKLTAISIFKKNDAGTYLWNCLCDCGNECIVKGSCLTRASGKTTSCGCLRESLVASELKTYLSNFFEAVPEYKIFKNPKTNLFLPFDIYVPKYKIFIEVQGGQHYKFSSRWHITKEVFLYSKYKDSLKKKYAEENGVYIEIDLRKVKTTEKAIEKILKTIRIIENV